MARRKRRTKAQIRKDFWLDMILFPWFLLGRVATNLIVIPVGMALGAITGVVLMAASTALAFLIGTVIVMAFTSL